MKKLALVLLALFLISPAVTQNVFACGAGCGGGNTVPQPRLIIEFAPVFASDNAGSNQTIGTYYPLYNAPFNIGPPSANRIDTDTGIYTRPYVPSGLAFFYNNIDYWIKTQTGTVAGLNQMVIQLEGSSKGGQGGMFDIINDGLKYASQQPVPGGDVFYDDQVRIGAYDLPFTSDPTILTNSRLQSHIISNLDFNPATQTLTTSWLNVNEDFNGVPIVHSFFDANGLDVWFDFRGGQYAIGASEDQGVRILTFFNGDFPLDSRTSDGGGTDIPEPTTMFLLGSGLLGLWGARKKFKK